MEPLTKRINNGFSVFLEKIRAYFGRYKVLFGEVLRKKSAISDEQLENALKKQKVKLARNGETVRLGRMIVDLGYSNENEVIKHINKHYRTSVVTLSDNLEEQISKKRRSFKEKLIFAYIPIWLKFSIAVISIIVLTIMVLSFIILDRQEERLYQQTVKTGMVSLNFISNNAKILLLNDDILGLNTLIKEAASVEGILYAIIANRKKEIKAHTDFDMIGEVLEKPTVIKSNEKIIKKGDVTYFNYTLASGERVLDLRRPLILKGKELGEANVGVSIDFIDELIYKERLFIGLIGLFILFIAVVAAVLFGLNFSRPISKLVDATREISKGNYQHKVGITRKDELGDLSLAFDYMTSELRVKSLMQKSFGKYVGPEVLDMILADPESVWLKGQKREATILFTDIRRFTAYSETKEPEEVVDVLNKYFDIVSHYIIKYGGNIDKFLGDGVLGTFGVPVFYEDHAERAVRAALDMQRKLTQLGKEGNKLLLSMGVGINSGVVISGNMGSQEKMEYTVIGDTVNLASRLNGLAGPGEIVVSGSVYKKVVHLIKADTLPPQKVKGKSKPVSVYKVLSIKERSNRDNEN